MFARSLLPLVNVLTCWRRGAALCAGRVDRWLDLGLGDASLGSVPQTFIDMEGSGFGGDLESLRVSVLQPGGCCPTMSVHKWTPWGWQGPGWAGVAPWRVPPTCLFPVSPGPGPKRLPRPPRAPRRPRHAWRARPLWDEQLGHLRTRGPSWCAWAGRAPWDPRPPGKACLPQLPFSPSRSTGNRGECQGGVLFLSGHKPHSPHLLHSPFHCSHLWAPVWG